MDRNVILAFLLSSVAVLGGVVALASCSSANQDMFPMVPSSDIGNGYTLSAGTVIEYTEYYGYVDYDACVLTIDEVSYKNVYGFLFSKDFVCFISPDGISLMYFSSGFDGYPSDLAHLDTLTIEEDRIVLDVLFDDRKVPVTLTPQQFTYAYCDVVLFLGYHDTLFPVFDDSVPSFATEVWVRCPFVQSDTPFVIIDSFSSVSGIFATGSISEPVLVSDFVGTDPYGLDISYCAVDSTYYYVDGYSLNISGFSFDCPAIPFVPESYFNSFVDSISSDDSSVVPDPDVPVDSDDSSDSPIIDFEIFGISVIGGVPVVYIIGGLVVLVFFLAIASGVRRR